MAASEHARVESPSLAGLCKGEILPERLKSSRRRLTPSWQQPCRSDELPGCRRSEAAEAESDLAGARNGSMKSDCAPSDAKRNEPGRECPLENSGAPRVQEPQAGNGISNQTRPAAGGVDPKRTGDLADDEASVLASSRRGKAKFDRAQPIAKETGPACPILRVGSTRPRLAKAEAKTLKSNCTELCGSGKIPSKVTSSTGEGMPDLQHPGTNEDASKQASDRRDGAASKCRKSNTTNGIPSLCTLQRSGNKSSHAEHLAGRLLLK